MFQDKTRYMARVAGPPIYPLLVPVPLAFFTATLVTDLVYWRTAEMQWANFSVWLLTAGLVTSGVAAVVGAVDFLRNKRVRATPSIWLYVIGNLIALALALMNAFVHSRDAYTSVVPTGLMLSAIVALIMIVLSWLGGAMVYRYGVGVGQ